MALDVMVFDDGGTTWEGGNVFNCIIIGISETKGDSFAGTNPQTFGRRYILKQGRRWSLGTEKGKDFEFRGRVLCKSKI